MATPDTCCDSNCPMAVSTVNFYTTDVDASNALKITVPAHNPTDDVAVVLQIIDEDSADVAVSGRIHLWFVDTNSKNAVPTLTPPSTPGASELDVVTNADGSYTLTVANTGALDALYLCAEMIGIVYISTVISIGV